MDRNDSWLRDCVRFLTATTIASSKPSVNLHSLSIFITSISPVDANIGFFSYCYWHLLVTRHVCIVSDIYFKCESHKCFLERYGCKWQGRQRRPSLRCMAITLSNIAYMFADIWLWRKSWSCLIHASCFLHQPLRPSAFDYVQCVIKINSEYKIVKIKIAYDRC